MESHGQSKSETQPPESPPKSGRARHRFRLGAIILLYLLAAYLLIPLAWKWQVRRHPELFDAPRVTHTPNGIPGDPVNVALLGSEADVIHAMVAAKWDPADPLTFRSSVRIAVDSVFRRPDEDAPVSTLELFGR